MRQQTCFQPAQKPPNCPERSTTKLIIDYSPGPDAVSRVMRKRTVPAAAEEANRTRSGPPDCLDQQPDCSVSRRQFGLAVQPEGIFGVKQGTYQASGGGSCSSQHDGDEFDQRAGNRLQPSDHRCHRVVPGQICQPKPRPSRPEPCFIPDLQSLAKQQQLLAGSQTQGIKMKPPCKQSRSTKRCFSAGAEPAGFQKQFPSFIDDNKVGKKKHRVSFAKEADIPNCTIYSQCGGGEQSSGPQNRKRANQRQAELRSVPCVSDMDPMAFQALPCPPSQAAKPTCSQQQRRPQRKAQQKRHDERQWCVGMYQEQQWPADTMEQCRHKREANLPCTKPQENQEESSECPEDDGSSENKKYQFASTCGEVQQPVEDCSDDSDQPNEPARPTCKHVKEEEVGGNSVEFEANQDDEDDEEESPEQLQATRRSTSKKVSLRQSSAVKTQDPCNKVMGSSSEQRKTRQSELRDRQRRDSNGYTVQTGVQDRPSSIIDDQKVKAEGSRRLSIGRKQMRKASSKMPDEQLADGSSKTSKSACRDKRERPICPQPTQPPCEGKQQPRKLRQRTSSEPCAQRYPQSEQRQKEPWNLKCQKTPKPTAVAAAATTAAPTDSATPAVPETCKKALQEDAEHRCRQEKAEKAKEAALKAALQGRRGSKGVPPVKPAGIPQPSQAPETETTELCHCSLHSDLSCDTPLDQVSQRGPKRKPEKQEAEPRRSSAQSGYGSDNSKFNREGHLLVRLDDSGRPTNSKVMSRRQRPCDIYSFCSEHQGDCGDEKADDEDQCEEAEDPEPPPPPPPEPEETSIPEDPPAAENTTGTSGATTEDTGDPVIRKKKCCC